MRTSLTNAFAETVGINSTQVTLGDIVDTGRRSSVIVPFVVSASNLNVNDVNALMTSTSASGFGQLFVAAAAEFGLTVAAPVVAVFDGNAYSRSQLVLYLIIASASIVFLILMAVLVICLCGCCRCVAKKFARRKKNRRMSKDDLFISTMASNSFTDEYKDRALSCKDCSTTFTFTIKQQEFYFHVRREEQASSRSLQSFSPSVPIRCKDCREKNKLRREVEKNADQVSKSPADENPKDDNFHVDLSKSPADATTQYLDSDELKDVFPNYNDGVYGNSSPDAGCSADIPDKVIVDQQI